MGIFELNQQLSSFYGNPKPIDPPLPFYLKIADKISTSEQSVDEIIYTTAKYILDPNKTTLYYGTVGGSNDHSLSKTSYNLITTQFMTIKQYYSKLLPYPIIHMIITFAPDYHMSPCDTYKVAELLTSLSDIFNSHQYIFAVHDKQWNYNENRYAFPHIHFLINTTNFRTGKTLDFNKTVFEKFRSNILLALDMAQILEPYGVSIRRLSKLYHIN